MLFFNLFNKDVQLARSQEMMEMKANTLADGSLLVSW